MRYLLILLSLILFLFLSLWVSQSRAADLYLYGAIGHAQSEVNDKRGLWKHEGQPYTFDGGKMGFRAGLGSTIQLGSLGPVTHSVRLELGAVSIGSSEIDSLWNRDEDYDRRGRCYKRCHELYRLQMENSYLGAELVAKYGITAWDWLEVYETGGLAGFAHDHEGTIELTWKKPLYMHHFPEQNLGQNWDGMLLAGVIGGGVCGKVYRGVALCGDVEKFLPFAHTANPLIGSGVDGPVLTTFQMRVPFYTF